MNEINIKKERRLIIYILLLALLLVSPQLFNYGSMTLFVDTPFHLSRFYDTYMQIKHHNFQPFIMMYGFESTGRYVNVFYGPLLAYFCGLLLFILRSYYRFQLVFNFLVVLCAGLTTNYMLKVGKINLNLRLYGVVTYMVSYPIMSWLIRGKFMGVGAALLPLIVAVAIRMVMYPQTPVKILEMIISMTLVMEVHTLTAVISIVLLTVTFIYALLHNKTNRRVLVKKTIFSAIVTLILTANVWFVYLLLSHQDKLLVPFPFADPQARILPWQESSSLNVTVLSALTFIAICVAVFIKFRKEISENTVFLGWLGVIFTALASGMFPWNKIFYLFKQLYILQFPYRLSPVGILLLIFVGLSILQTISLSVSENKIISLVLISLMILEITQSFSLFSSTLGTWNSVHLNLHADIVKRTDTQPYELQKAFESKNLDSPWLILQKSVSDYLPSTTNTQKWSNASENMFVKDTNMEKLDKQYIHVYLNTRFKKNVKGHHIVVRWHQEGSHQITIPIAHYKNTQYILNGKKLNTNQVKTGKSGASVIQGKNGKNKLLVKYKFKLHQ